MPEAVDLESAFLDTTCLSANIHYPVDWVLLRDATRTLMKAVQLIRGQGLKHRMEEPQSFLTRINRLCIQMTHASRQTRAVSASARKPCARWTSWSARCAIMPGATASCWSSTGRKPNGPRPQAQQVLRRMDQVLEQLPQARQQARQRILQGQPVANADKILSLYEPDVHVIVRKKAGAEVEFGNTLLLAENPQGLDSGLGVVPRERAGRFGAAALEPSVAWKHAYGPKLKAVAADRGFDNEVNRIGLAEDGIYNAVCPRSPQATAREERFLEVQTLAAAARPNRGAHQYCQKRLLKRAHAQQGFPRTGNRRSLGPSWCIICGCWPGCNCAPRQCRRSSALFSGWRQSPTRARMNCAWRKHTCGRKSTTSGTWDRIRPCGLGMATSYLLALASTP